MIQSSPALGLFCNFSEYWMPAFAGMTIKAMAAPKILVIPGSLRTGSSNARLAALATKELVLAEA